MDRSRFIAGLIGPTFAAIAVSLLINRDLILRMVEDVRDDPALIVVAGIITLIGGLAVVTSHNVWRGWPLLVTAFGWMAVVGGLMRIILPGQVVGVAAAVARDGGAFVPVVAAGLLLLGLFLSFKAFVPERTPESR